MEDYSNNTNLILKKNNSILDKVNLSLQNKYHKEGFDKNQKKFKSYDTVNTFDTAKSMGFIFIPNYRFKSINTNDSLEKDKTIRILKNGFYKAV
jgi:hypothetical protein